MSAPRITPTARRLDELFTDAAWIADALCQDIADDRFFPKRGESTAPAKAICAVCPVRSECLEHALAVPERFGIWGGLSERQRRRIRATRGVAE